MKINQIQNSNHPSFQGWNPSAKKRLALIVSKLSKEKTQPAVDLINKIEEKSHQHYLFVQPNGIVVSVKDWKYMKVAAFFFRKGLGLKKVDFVDLLQRIEQHVDNDNVRIAKIKKVVKTVTSKFKTLPLKSSSHGYGLDLKEKDSKEILIVKIARLAEEKNGQEKVNKAIELVKDIDEMAKNTCVRVDNPVSSSAHIIGGRRTGLYLVDAKIPEKKDILAKLVTTYKMIVRESAKGDKAYERYQRQLKKGKVKERSVKDKARLKQERKEKWQKFKADLKERFLNNPLFKVMAKKAQLQQQKVDKIAQQLKIEET